LNPFEAEPFKEDDLARQQLVSQFRRRREDIDIVVAIRTYEIPFHCVGAHVHDVVGVGDLIARARLLR